MIDFMLFDPKINIQPSILWWVGGIAITFVGGVIATTVKVMTRNHISRNEAYKNLRTNDMCNERTRSFEGKIDGLKEHMNIRFDDLKGLINKNNGRG